MTYYDPYVRYGGVGFDDDILLPNSSGRFSNIGAPPVDGNGIVHIRSSAFTTNGPSGLNFNFEAKALPQSLAGRLTTTEWADVQKEFNQVLIDYPVDYAGLAAATLSDCMWCLLCLLFLVPYLILSCQYNNKKTEVRRAEQARENALDVKVDEMNVKYKGRGIIFDAGDNALWVEIKMIKRYNITCPPGAAWPKMVTTRIKLSSGSTINVIVPVPRGVVPGQVFQAQWTPGESSMVIVGQQMAFQAEVPPTAERDPNGTVCIYTPSGQPCDLTLPVGATPGSKVTYELTYDSAGVPHASIVSAPTAQQLEQAKAFDKIADFGDEEELATANYHPEGAEMLYENNANASKVKVVCPANSFPGSTIQITAPSGQMLQATVPAGIFPGQEFLVAVPAAMGSSAPPLDPAALKSGLFLKDATEISWNPSAPPAPSNTSSTIPPAGAGGTTTLNVTVPAGVSPGGSFLVNTPNGGQVQVTCPPGVAPGQTIQIQVNSGAVPPASKTAAGDDDAALKAAIAASMSDARGPNPTMTGASAPPIDMGSANGGAPGPSFL